MCCRCFDREFSVEQSNIYFTVKHFMSYGSLKPGMQMREIFVRFNTFYSRSSFLDYAGFRVKSALNTLNQYLDTDPLAILDTFLVFIHVVVV